MQYIVLMNFWQPINHLMEYLMIGLSVNNTNFLIWMVFSNKVITKLRISFD